MPAAVESDRVPVALLPEESLDVAAVLRVSTVPAGTRWSPIPTAEADTSGTSEGDPATTAGGRL